jgi:hypothetical protein
LSHSCLEIPDTYKYQRRGRAQHDKYARQFAGYTGLPIYVGRRSLAVYCDDVF